GGEQHINGNDLALHLRADDEMLEEFWLYQSSPKLSRARAPPSQNEKCEGWRQSEKPPGTSKMELCERLDHGAAPLRREIRGKWRSRAASPAKLRSSAAAMGTQ